MEGKIDNRAKNLLESSVVKDLTKEIVESKQ